MGRVTGHLRMQANNVRRKYTTEESTRKRRAPDGYTTIYPGRIRISPGMIPVVRYDRLYQGDIFHLIIIV